MRHYLILMGIVWLMGMAVAQQSETKSAPPKDDPAEIERLLLALSDIVWLNYVIPLHLSPEQMDKLIEANGKAIKRAEELFKTENKELKAKQDEITRVRQAAMKGKSVPEEFIKTMREIENKALKRRRELRVEVVRAMATELKPIFTEAQIDTMVEKSKQSLQLAGYKLEQLQGTKDQYYEYYVENIFLIDRAPLLLREFKESSKQE